MSHHLSVLDLGEDADLLVKPDEYLDNQLADLATQISILSTQYDSILRAKSTKRALQQQNHVAVQLLQRDHKGNIVDIIIQVMPLPDALMLLRRQLDGTDQANTAAQCSVWERDGYDLPTSAELRHSG